MNITLLRFTARQMNAATYAVVSSDQALPVLAHVGSRLAETGLDMKDFDIDTMPWDTLPGVRQLAEIHMAFKPPGTIMFIGNAVDGTWTQWYPPCPPPPVPPVEGKKP